MTGTGPWHRELAARIVEARTGDDRTLVPTLTASAANGAHRMNYNFTLNHYDRNGTGTENLSTISHGMRYTYAQKIDSLTLEVRNDYRNPETSDTTDSFLAGITWVRNFDGVDSLLALPFAQGVSKSEKRPSPTDRPATRRPCFSASPRK